MTQTKSPPPKQIQDLTLDELLAEAKKVTIVDSIQALARGGEVPYVQVLLIEAVERLATQVKGLTQPGQ